jgi:hypothetical protein
VSEASSGMKLQTLVKIHCVLSIFMPYLASNINLLVRETSRYYCKDFDTCDKTPFALPGITNSEVVLYLAHYMNGL